MVTCRKRATISRTMPINYSIRIGMGYRVNDLHLRVDGSIKVDDPYRIDNFISDAAAVTFATPASLSGVFISDAQSYPQPFLPGWH
jgi:hypothetical protein